MIRRGDWREIEKDLCLWYLSGMKLAVMQPYLFPYIGYFQLIHAVDVFVFYDDVQYKKGGWINRNRILLNGRDFMISFPIKDKLEKRINQRFFGEHIDKEKTTILKQIKSAYSKAPHFNEVYPLLEKIISHKENNVSLFAINQVKLVCSYLGLAKRYIRSSELEKNEGTNYQARVIEINKMVGSEHYINLMGGRELYHKDEFEKAGLLLSFIQSEDIEYPQFENDFVANLSIIDVLMFNSRDFCLQLLGKFSLQPAT